MDSVLRWLFDFISESATAFSYINSVGFDIGSYHFTMLSILSIGGLFVYLGIAVIMWVVK